MPVNSNRDELNRLQNSIAQCRLCPRLVRWREKVAKDKTARFRDWNYWGKPVPGFGDANARLLIVGLAPAAQGGNRTGRMFTGDRSGDWLFRALHKFGFANQPASVSRDDGLTLQDCHVTAAVRCAPPQNKPLPGESQNCRQFLLKELRLLSNVRVIVALGKFASDALFESFRELEMTTAEKRPVFAHGKEFSLNKHQTLIASYHPSQQNTFTRRLTEPMFDRIFRRARALVMPKVVTRSKRQEARGKRQEARGKKQEARGKKQEARSKRQEARSKKQEARGKRQEQSTKNQQPRTKNQKLRTKN